MEHLGERMMDDLRRWGTELHRRTGALMLYLFLVPLFISVMVSLFAGHYKVFLLKTGGLLLWTLAAMLVTRGIREEIAYRQASIAKAPVIPLKIAGSLLLGGGVFYLGWVVGHVPVWKALFVGFLATAGSLLYYGIDPRKNKLPPTEDMDPELLLRNLTEARDSLERVRLRSEAIHDLRLHREIQHAIDMAEEILDQIEADPRAVRMARKFLVVYIDGVERVTDRYLAVEESQIDEGMKERLYTLLREVQERFRKELRELKSRDLFDLDVQIDALRRQIRD